MNKSLTRFSILLIIAALFTACSLRKPVATHALNYNLALEKAQNEAVFLNIIRAAQRRPKHFTALTQIRGTATASLAPSLTLPVDEAARSSAVLKLGGTGSAGISTADFVVLDSQEFVRGIMNPISLDQFAYYWNQGWQKEFLLALLVREIHLDGQMYRNVPRAGFHEVREFLEKIREIKGKIDFEDKVEVVGPTFELKEAQDLATLIPTAEKGGLEIRKADGAGYQYVRQEQKKQLTIDGKPMAEEKIFLRSVEGVIYYLGQILRYQTDPQPRLKYENPDGSEFEVGLFYHLKGKEARKGDAEIRVNYDGETYVIPKPTASAVEDRSMEALGIVLQLMGLNKSREELPATGVVTVVGG